MQSIAQTFESCTTTTTESRGAQTAATVTRLEVKP